MEFHALRIKDGSDLRQEIVKFCKAKKICSGVIVSGVGGFSRVSIRMAGAKPESQNIIEHEEASEIIVLQGTIAKDQSMHVHLAVSDGSGKVIGGHFKTGIVRKTVELVIISDEKTKFIRELDEVTGFRELVVENK